MPIGRSPQGYKCSPIPLGGPFRPAIIPVPFRFPRATTRPSSSMLSFRSLTPVVIAVGILGGGCGTTRSTDTSRTATEQLLVSDAIDRTVQQLHFHRLAGDKVYLDDTYLANAVDKPYLVSTLRQHLLASGCILTPTREEATYVLEARAGSVGTNRSEVLFGVPAINLPMVIPGVPSSIPEIPVAKRTDHRGVAKIGVFAYHRETGTVVWQSGLVRDESSGKDWWILGAGPLQYGTIHDEPEFAGSRIPDPLIPADRRNDGDDSRVSIAQEKLFQQQPVRIQRLPNPNAADSQRTAGGAPAETSQ